MIDKIPFRSCKFCIRLENSDDYDSYYNNFSGLGDALHPRFPSDDDIYSKGHVMYTLSPLPSEFFKAISYMMEPGSMSRVWSCEYY